MNTEVFKWLVFTVVITFQSLLYYYLICHSQSAILVKELSLPISSSKFLHYRNYRHTKEREEKPLRLDLLVASRPKILLWTRMWFVGGKAGYYINDQDLQDCPVACEIIDDKRRFYEADAIVFHGRDLEGKYEVIPQRARSSQLYVFYSIESPVYHKNWSFIPQNVFNWTLTYRSDSDVTEPFGYLVTKKSASKYSYKNHSATTANYRHAKFPTKTLTRFKSRYLRYKHKLIGWIVTRCETHGKREAIVTQLQRELTIDIYGACGNLNCSTRRGGKDIFNCYHELGKTYKFYLSLENSLCTDYVTEKFFRALENNMVPIVYGDVDYSLYAPPGSYIDVRDFPSIRKLAQYLQYLDLHPEEYLKYFLWKEKYKILHRIKFCNLCHKLWQHSIIDTASGRRVMDPTYRKAAGNVDKWWTHRPRASAIGPEGELPSCILPNSTAKTFSLIKGGLNATLGGNRPVVNGTVVGRDPHANTHYKVSSYFGKKSPGKRHVSRDRVKKQTQR